jgi:hypothetical protein
LAHGSGRTDLPDLAAASAALNKESVTIMNSLLSRLIEEGAHWWQLSSLKFDYVRRRQISLAHIYARPHWV